MQHVAKALPLVALVAAGCGAARHAAPLHPAQAHRARAAETTPDPRPAAAPLQALVTDQTQNRVLVVSIPAGKVIRRVGVTGDPTYVAATPKAAVVVSSDAGTVTLLARRSLHVIRVFHGFSAPHIPAVSPDGRYGYVTDDASGIMSVIALRSARLIGRVYVGAGAHHLAISPDGRHVWVALSQTARTITLLSTVNPSRPRVVGYLHPPFLAHDLLFSPGGRDVWVTSADTSYVAAFNARTHRLLFRVPAGAPPQHLAFANGNAYITSGYGASIERVDLNSGRVLRRVSAPYGSFDLDAAGGYVATASLLRGTLAIYDKQLRLIRVRQLAPSTEDVALSRP
jgi:DNA-binding beta-propeller fold protein YncE